MTFLDAVRTVLAKTLVFSGRAPRSEYWWFLLFSILFGLAITMLEGALGLDWWYDGRGVLGELSPGPLSLVVQVGLLLPSLSVTARRLQDRDASGRWALIFLVMYIPIETLGAPVWLLLILAAIGLGQLIYLIGRGTAGDNRYGPDPLAPPTEAEIFR